MYLTRHETETGPRWAVDDFFLPQALTLALLLELPAAALRAVLAAAVTPQPASGALLPPVEAEHEIWAAGVTYLHSRKAREAESQTADIYTRVYNAERPELFLKATGARAVGHLQPVRVRPDSFWNTPEPEAVLVVNSRGEVVGYCAGNDVSSRSIEGENPLYLPQAKLYDGACALGPGIRLLESDWADLAITLEIYRAANVAFSGTTTTRHMKRAPHDLVSWLFRELSFPHGAFLFTGTGLVPPDSFSLCPGDVVRVGVGELILENPVK